MHLERLLQGGIGGSEQPPTSLTSGGTIGAGSAPLGDVRAPADSTTGVFSSALGALTGDGPEGVSEVAKPGTEIVSELSKSGTEIVSDLPASGTEIVPDLLVPGVEIVSELVAPGVAQGDADAAVGVDAEGDAEPDGADGEAAGNAVGISVVVGQSGRSAFLGAVSPEIDVAGVERFAVAPTGGGDQGSRAAAPGKGTLVASPGPSAARHGEASAVGTTPEGGSLRTVLPPVGGTSRGTGVGESVAAGSSTGATAGAGAPAGVAGTASAAIGVVAPGDGATLAAEATAVSSSKETPPPLAAGEGGARSVPLSPQEIEDAGAETERTPTTGTLETRAATRHEGHAEPAILAALRARAEVGSTREHAATGVAPRGDTSAADPAAATTREGSGLVAGIVAEETSTGSTLLRAGVDAGIAPALQGLAREAGQRQRAQATVTPASGVTSSDAEGSAATPSPGTSPQAAPSASASVLARIDQPQGFAALAERVVDAVHLSAARGGAEIRLRVEPQGLGHIDVRIQLQDDGVRAMIVAEHESTRALISSQQHVLEAALGRSELRLSGFSVDVSLDQGATDFHEAEQGWDHDGASKPVDRAASDAAPSDDEARSVSLETGRLSLRV